MLILQRPSPFIWSNCTTLHSKWEDKSRRVLKHTPCSCFTAVGNGGEKKPWAHLKYEQTTPQQYLHLSFEILGGVLWGFIDDLVNITHVPGRQGKRKLREILNKVPSVGASVPKCSKMARFKLASSSNNNEVQVLCWAIGQIKKNQLLKMTKFVKEFEDCRLRKTTTLSVEKTYKEILNNNCRREYGVLLYNRFLSSDYSYYDLHNCGTQYFRRKSSFTVTIKLIKRFRFKV